MWPTHLFKKKEEEEKEKKMDHSNYILQFIKCQRDHELMYNLYPSRANLEHPGKSIIGLGRHRSSYFLLSSFLFLLFFIYAHFFSISGNTQIECNFF